MREGSSKKNNYAARRGESLLQKEGKTPDDRVLFFMGGPPLGGFSHPPGELLRGHPDSFKIFLERELGAPLFLKGLPPGF